MDERPVYALVLAGGSGTRFWPLSRNERPKQLLKLFDDETLLEKAVRRIEQVVPRENVLVLTNTAQEAAVREVLAHRRLGDSVLEHRAAGQRERLVERGVSSHACP